MSTDPAHRFVRDANPNTNQISFPLSILDNGFSLRRT
jgi:hypothetical protein